MTNPRPFEDDVWELYDLREDFSQAIDIADQHPGRLAELQQIFEREAARVGILPLQDARVARVQPGLRLPRLNEGRTSFRFHAGTLGVPESQAPRMLGRSWHLRAALDVHGPEVHGVVATMGGRAAGWSLWVDTSGCPRFTYRTFEVHRVQLSGKPLGTGRRQVEVVFRAERQGTGGALSLIVDGQTVETGRISATPRYFSIDETFDIGVNTGSPVGAHPAAFPITGAEIVHVDIEVDTGGL